MSFVFYLVIPIMIGLMILQSAVLPHFPIFNVVPQFWFLITVAWALLRGWREGLVLAFIAGILIDLFSATPLGVTSLAAIGALVVVLILQRSLPANRVLIPALLTVIATLVFWFFYLTLLRILIPLLIQQQNLLGLRDLSQKLVAINLVDQIGRGYSFRLSTFQYVLVTSFLHGIFAIPFYWLVTFVERFSRSRRVEI